MLAVVFYHFNILSSLSKNGFIGVDVFFVISGYLITQLINSEISSYHWVRRFYFRRIRRIFPALIVVIIVTLVISGTLMLPIEFKRLGQEIIGGSTFSSNLVYLQQAGYFDRSALEKPLLHLWSLGVEEQFYIFWPIFMFLVFKLRLNKNLFLSILTIISFTNSITL